MNIILSMKKLIPSSIKNKIKNRIFRYQYKRVQVSHIRALENVKAKPVVKVAFFVIHESVWKYDEIYRMMNESSAFEPIVIVCPYTAFGTDVMNRDMEQVYNAFIDRGVNVIRSLNPVSGEWLDVKKKIAPDIVFFTNPWGSLTKKDYRIESYLDRLTCYVPYGFKNSYLYEAHFNQPMQNLVWKFFVETPIHKSLSEKYSRNKGRNVIVSGFPGMDKLLGENKDVEGPWKLKGSTHKRIIWAPHHTIPGYGATLDYSTFLLYADFMFDIAYKYRDKIQIAFKPHPILRSKLELDDVWGKERTKHYFERWANLENGILVEGDYISLFETSDGLINDSSSFVVEYLYTGKPMLFLLGDEDVLQRFNEVGSKVISLSYVARSSEQIESFIMSVVLEENDTQKDKRHDFFNRVVKPPNNKTASENIFNYLKDELF